MIVSTNSISITSGFVPPQISTEEAAQSFMQNSPIGSIFKYVGQTTQNFTNGALYQVAES